jgi:hypothetical protein
MMGGARGEEFEKMGKAGGDGEWMKTKRSSIKKSGQSR